MKDQDYIKIMDRISKDKIEEAFTWDASAQKNRRSIRRLSAGIGAIAAAIAVVIGTIGYDAYRDRLLADSGAETSGLSEESLNLLGGHGEIRGFIGSSGTPLFRDDDCYYMQTNAGAENTEFGGGIREVVYRKWAINGSTASEAFNCDDNLLTDGEQHYIYANQKLFTDDSYGSGFLFSDVPWKPCAIQKLSKGWYFLSAYVENSWLDGEPKPYVLLNTNGDSPKYQFVDYGDVRSDGNGTTIYFRKENQIYCAPINAPDHGYLLADAGQEPDCLLDWTVDSDRLYYIVRNGSEMQYCAKALNPDAPVESVTVNDPDDPALYDQLREYFYFNRQKTELHTVTYTYRDDVLEFHVNTSGQPIYPPMVSSECYFYSVPAAELWGDDLPDLNERPFMEFFDTGEHIIFTLPKDGKHGEQLVQLRKESGAYQYVGENYAPEQPANYEPDISIAVPIETVPQADSGFCSEDTFSLYYIPQEHHDTENIQCYRMLPAVKASESKFDAERLGNTLPQGGGFRPDPNKTPHIGIDEAKQIILNGDPNDTGAIFTALNQAAENYAGKYPYESIGRVCYEYWLSDDGSEFIVAMCSYAGEQETIEFVYFRYDRDAGQFAYQYMPARMRDQASEAHSTETNALGGKGRIRAFEDKSDVSEIDGPVLSVAEDDEYVYDLERCLRARKTDGKIVFEAFSVPGVPQYDPEHNQEQNLFVTCGMVLTFNQGALYELKTDGSLTPLLTLSEDSAGNPVANVRLTEVRGFAPDTSGRPEKLFLRGGAQFRNKTDNDADYRINAILNLKTGKYYDLDFTGIVSKYIRYYVKEDAVYVIGRYDAKAAAKLTGGDIQEENSYVLVKFVDDGTCIPVSTSEWKFAIFLEAFFDQDRNIWFLDEYGKCCKGNIDDRSVTEGSTEEMYSVKDSVAGVKYREGSCVHIAVSVVNRQKSGRDKPVSMIVYTMIDGENVSSYTVRYPA